MKKLLVAAPLALLFAAGCGGGATPTGTPGQPGTPDPTGGSPAPTQAAEAIVCLPDRNSGDVSATIVDFGYEPSTVSAAVGQVVSWTNTGQAPHTVTFDEGPNCGQANAGGTVAAQFNEAGEYDFHCAIHPSMRGSVTVNP